VDDFSQDSGIRVTTGGVGCPAAFQNTAMVQFMRELVVTGREREGSGMAFAVLKQMKRTCGGRTTPQAMGRYIMRTGSMGLGSMRFTSPRITGHRHRSDRSSVAA
jgi:hypothetical protein